MKQIFGPAAGALACGLLLVFGCGGSSFEGPGGGGSTGTSGSSSGGQNAAGSSTKAGDSSGGSASGGGGTAAGGSATAGSSSAGTTSGGMASGGASNGGAASTSCDQDADCVDCAYPTAPQTEQDCYCAICAATPMTKSACAANQAAFSKVCANVHRPCPAIACVLPPEPVCKSHMCVAK